MKIFVTTNKVLIVLLFSAISTMVQGQDTNGIVKMEQISLKISAFTAEDFIKSTKKDTSFYRAFKNMKIIPHTEKSKVWVLQKDGGDEGKMVRDSKHYNENNLSWNVITNEKNFGKFYNRKGEHKYFTGEMFDRVFFPRDTVFASNTVANPYQQKNPEDRSRIEKYYEQLKTFMFAPGTGVDGVPFIGDKLNIFSEEMRPYYDFTLTKVKWQDSIPCYLFSCKRKPEYGESKVVVQTLDTYYDRRTMKIIARKYHIRERNLAMSFDINMDIRLRLVGTEYFPSLIRYDGNWKVPFKKRERLSFEIQTFLLN